MHLDPRKSLGIGSRTRSPVLRYGVALLLCGLATGIDFVFPRFRAQTPIAPFYLATIVAAWFGGFPAGLLASVVSAVAVEYCFITPRNFVAEPVVLLRLLLAGFVMGMISWLIDNRARARQLIATQREQAKDQQRRHQAILSSAAQIAGMGGWEYDIINDRLVWDNETIRIFGITRDAFGGDMASFLALVHSDDREALRAMQVEALASDGMVEMEYRIVRPDGSVRRVYDRGQVTRYEAGKPAQTTGMVMDITEQRQAEEAQRASEDRWRAIFENSVVGIALADPDGGYMATNRAYQRMVGYTDEELRSLSSIDITYEGDRAASLDLDAQVWQGKLQQFQHEKRFRRKDGRLIWVRNTVSLAPGTKTVPRFGMEIIEDITERRSLEEQLRQSQKMEALGRLAGGVAHDFNNMLGVILGHCELLEGQLAVQDPLRKRLEKIQEAALRSANLTRQLLAFSRKQVLLPETLDLNATIGEMSSMLRSLVGDDVELIIRPGNKLGYVKADPGQIAQMVMNLLVNARDAVPHGGRIVIESGTGEDLEDHPSVPDGSYLTLSVSDTGSGIKPEIMDHIFEPFFTTKEHGRGTGLGLSMVYAIVQQSDGHIRVSSEPGRGTTFTIYLPRTEGHPKAIAEPAETGSVAGGHETVLIAEDEPLLSEFIRINLESVGYTVLEAHGTAEAIEIARKHSGSIDLLLTDVLMPGTMNGLELAASLGSLRPKLKVLYMTGYSANLIDRKGMADLQNRLLQKPFSGIALRRRIREVLASA
ncbi:MAG TPA: PAS domain S-box protein [Verrucomicrobiae bacterium]|jgi:two-component system cell cycle sensor histidine kinase/response regulator CckA|nr:PAS domain S-box protein [Verrucomicrobiae bacterium]